MTDYSDYNDLYGHSLAPKGVKHDQQKARLELLPPQALLEVGKSLTYGAEKYSDDNWKRVENGSQRYIGAALRHITAHLNGEVYDEESGNRQKHLAAAIASLMFVLELQHKETEQ